MVQRPRSPRAASGPDRRRVLTIMGATTGGLALGGGALLLAGPREVERKLEPVEWRGVALGAPVRIVLFDENRARARTLLARVAGEIDVLEDEFSLYRPHSSISRLNRAGRLERPTPVFRQLLDESARLSALTAGAFDPTVQPLWVATAERFRTAGRPPPPRELDSLRTLVDWRAVDSTSGSVRFRRSGMGLTLNGIAQGFMTDRVTERLRDGGLRHALVELGETRAIGGHPAGRPWRVGIPAPDGSSLLGVARVSGEAIATSGGYGTPFDASGEWHHIFDPRTARSAHRHQSVSVIAPTATEADALATAFAVMPEAAAAAAARGLPGVRVRISDHAGRTRVLGAGSV